MTGFWSDTAAWLSDPASVKALAPGGRLRAGIAVGPTRSAVWTSRDPRGRPQGVTVDIAQAIADACDLPLDLVEFSSSGAVIAGGAESRWDVAFAPVDDVRKSQVLFGPNYYVGESTLMTSAACGVVSLEGADRAGFRIAGVEDTATIRSARRRFAQADVLGAASLEQALSMFETSAADALALGRESLKALRRRFPNAPILDEAFHSTGTAAAVPRGASAALEIVSAIVEDLKTDGAMRAIFDRHGMTDSAMAPPGSRS